MLPLSSSSHRRRRSRSLRRRGMTMIEMIIVIMIIAIIVGIAVIQMATILRHERVNRAAQVLTQDLQNGFAMAGRQRAPVRLTFYPTTLSYVFSDRATGNVLQTRFLSKGTEYSLTSLTSTATTIDVLPNGIGSTSFVVTLANGDYQRKVTATSAGFVRMSPQ